MGRELAEAYPVVQETFADADAILGYSLSALCFGGPAESLTETVNAQPAILTASIGAWRALQAVVQRTRLRLPPGCMAGHSLGAYSALVAAGALDFSDAVRLTRTRGEVMAAAGAMQPGNMAAILKLEDAQVAALCAQAAGQSGDVVQVANYNGPGQVVISGGPAGVAAAMELARIAGGRSRLLAVSIAAHSVLMAPAVARFAEAVSATPFRPPQLPVIGACGHARPLTTPEEIRAELVAQLTAAVRWTEAVQYMIGTGATLFVEVGPGEVLTGLVKRIGACSTPDVETTNIRTPEDVEGFAGLLMQRPI